MLFGLMIAIIVAAYFQVPTVQLLYVVMLATAAQFGLAWSFTRSQTVVKLLVGHVLICASYFMMPMLTTGIESMQHTFYVMTWVGVGLNLFMATFLGLFGGSVGRTMPRSN